MSPYPAAGVCVYMEVSCVCVQVKEVDQSGAWFEDGMKLEAIDPLNLSAICVATVRKVRTTSLFIHCVNVTAGKTL